MFFCIKRVYLFAPATYRMPFYCTTQHPPCSTAAWLGAEWNLFGDVSPPSGDSRNESFPSSACIDLRTLLHPALTVSAFSMSSRFFFKSSASASSSCSNFFVAMPPRPFSSRWSAMTRVGFRLQLAGRTNGLIYYNTVVVP